LSSWADVGTVIVKREAEVHAKMSYKPHSVLGITSFCRSTSRIVFAPENDHGITDS
jgi:hypothetical protein